jgi:N-acetylneuraminic acid mutarotase
MPPLPDLFRWTERSPMPLPRAGCAAGVLDGQLVVAGGTLWEDDRKVWRERVDRFDPRRNAWEPCAPMPRPHGDAAGVVLGSALYVIGGGADGAAGTSVWRFQAGTWSELPEAALPAPRRSPAWAIQDGTVFLLGGYEDKDLTSAAATLWSWKPGGRWEERAPRPGPIRFSPAVASVAGLILVAGGATVENGEVRNLDDILLYDPRSDAWSTLGRLPAASRAASGLADRSRFWYIGGYTDKFERGILAIDPKTGKATPEGELPHGLADARFLWVEGRIIGVSGESGVKQRAPWTLEAGAKT